jgi:hypothetical protein
MISNNNEIDLISDDEKYDRIFKIRMIGGIIWNIAIVLILIISYISSM